MPEPRLLLNTSSAGSLASEDTEERHDVNVAECRLESGCFFDTAVGLVGIVTGCVVGRGRVRALAVFDVSG